MAGVNKVILIGNLGKDPEMKYGQTSNKPVCRFSLAVNERRGEGQTEWFNIVCFDRTAEIANEYLVKGQQVYIEGRLQTRKYQDQNGQDRYMTEVIANNMTMLGGRRDSADENAPRREAAPPPPRPAAREPRPAAQDDPFSGDFGPPPTEDDMPF